MSKSLYLDTEFTGILKPRLDLVCLASFDSSRKEKRSFWLYNEPDSQKQCREYLQQFDTLISYSAIAEGRALIAMGLDPLKFRWIDLYLEWRCLTNHNDELQYGYQLVNGREKKVNKPRPKWQREEGETETGFRPTHSLAEATFKLLGKIRDTDHKKKMRDLIISAPHFFTDQEKIDIQAYCMEDVMDLPDLLKAMVEKYIELDPGYLNVGG